MTSRKTILTYRDAGVNIDAGNRLVERIRDSVARTRRPEVLGGLGGFGGLFELDVTRYKKPVLVGATDGVGTKLKLALATGLHDGIGIDLVAMCVNDVIVQGAEPLFFLDYYATGRLDVDAAATVIEGIAKGCELAGAALIGGETAELPGMYHNDDYDLAGFCVGVVERDRVLDGSAVAEGDVLLGIASTGPHANGYSLIRRIIEAGNVDISSPLGHTTLKEALMCPTRIYVRTVMELLQQADVHAIAHITGGGLTDNVPRVLPAGARAVIDIASWQLPPVFRWLQENGDIATPEMLRTFNCGVGMVLVVDRNDAAAIIDFCASHGEDAWQLGRVVGGEPGVEFAGSRT